MGFFSMLPAHAGVILYFRFLVHLTQDVTRTRGGDPILFFPWMLEFLMLPAHAGVILTPRTCQICTLNVTRTRGGDPVHFLPFFYKIKCYPHTRG